MRRLSPYALLLTLAGLAVAVAVVFARANDPRSAQARDDNPFGDGGNTAPAEAKSSASKAHPAQSPAESADDAPPGLRPYPPAPAPKPPSTGQVMRRAAAPGRRACSFC